eukprot:560973-Amorphochlora_amoeboformis.AAC.1
MEKTGIPWESPVGFLRDYRVLYLIPGFDQGSERVCVCGVAVLRGSSRKSQPRCPMPASQTTSRFVCPKGIRIDVEADSPRRKRKAASGLRGAKKKSKSPTVAVSRSSPAALCSPTKSSLSSPARNRRISRGRRCEPAREVKAEFVMEKETNKSRPTRRHSMPHFMICPGCKSNLE